jgi:GT2 family glycosyltransferase
MLIAVLMTVHNRRDITLRCLDSLFAQMKPDGWGVKVFMVDDGSTDGTSASVRSKFPQVTIIQGSGHLYWNQGMRLAWQTALQSGENFDGYLWLNDDVTLNTNALVVLKTGLKHQSSIGAADAILVGSCKDPNTDSHSYGGCDASNQLIFSEDQCAECHHFNGNFVFVSAAICRKVGILSDQFTHAFGDWEYGYRASRAGIQSFVLPGYVGYCAPHGEGKWSDRSYPLAVRWREFHKPTGLNPQDFFRYKKMTSGVALACLYYANSYRRMLLGIAH